jgi:hypothetical protein
MAEPTSPRWPATNIRALDVIALTIYSTALQLQLNSRDLDIG